MKSTIMEYGLIIISVMLIIAILNVFLDMILDAGSLKEALIDYIDTIC
jgi:hypothetical protein